MIILIDKSEQESYDKDMIFLGSDHRGFELKERIKNLLDDYGYQFIDLGNDHLDASDDYVDFSRKVANAVSNDSSNKGIVLCGSGVGVDIVANKVNGIRCALVSDVQRAKQSREHEDANILALPADILDEESAWGIVQAFLNTEFSEESRHQRRLEKLEEVEEQHR